MTVAALVELLQRVMRTRVFEWIATTFGIALLTLALVPAARGLEGARIEVGYLIASIAGFASSWAALAAAWSILLAPPSKRVVLHGWLRSQILRYVPGGVWAPMSRFATMDGPNRARAILLGAETMAVASTATLVAAAAASWALDWRWALLVPLGVAGVAVAARMVAGVTGPTQRARWLATLLGAATLYAIGSGFAQRAVSDDIGFAAAAAAGGLAWVAGYLVFFAPSGLGAKEWAYIGLLAVAPVSSAALGVVAARGCAIAGELVVLAASALAGLHGRRRAAAGSITARP